MKTAGIDIGAKTVKVVVVRDGKPVAMKIAPAGLDAPAVLERVLADALSAAGGLAGEDLDLVLGTGIGSGEAQRVDDSIAEDAAAARGARALVPSARTVIDVGADEGRAIRCGESGEVIESAVNEKCAAGAGIFAEAMARALEVDLSDLGPLSLRATQAAPMHAQCTVFAESEMVALLHANTPREEIARAVHDAMAVRIASMTRKLGIRRDVVAVGGLALNEGFIDSLRRDLQTEVLVPESPEFAGALGAALIAADRAGAGR
jgi:benzoyl-CoA reductase subunit D